MLTENENEEERAGRENENQTERSPFRPTYNDFEDCEYNIYTRHVTEE